MGMIPRQRKNINAAEPFDPTEEIPNDPFRTPDILEAEQFGIQTSAGMLNSGANIFVRDGELVIAGDGLDGNLDYGVF
jgi:hypothetical protein